MLPETIAQIILESIKLTRVILEGIPIDQRQAMWTQHEERMKFWRDLLDKLNKGLQSPGGPSNG